MGSCPRKLCVPTREDLVRSFIAIVQGGVADKIRVCARTALNLVFGNLLDELLWFL